MTVLMSACDTNHVVFVEALLEFNNIDINLQEKYGWTALMRSCYHGYIEIVSHLLGCKDINVNLKDSQGNTAIMHVIGNSKNSLLLTNQLL